MTEKITGLQPGMSLEQVAALAGKTAIFKVTRRVESQPGSRLVPGITIPLGSSGLLFGTTHSEPPLQWSVYMTSGIQAYRPGRELTAETLQQRNFQTETFELKNKS